MASAFGQVQGALSWFINVYSSYANWKATVERLTGFTEALEREMRRRAAERDAELLREKGADDDLDGLVAWTAAQPNI